MPKPFAELTRRNRAAEAGGYGQDNAWGFAPNPTKNLRFLDFPLKKSAYSIKDDGVSRFVFMG